MKLAGHILSFYLLLLSAVPCCAFDKCPEDLPVNEAVAMVPVTPDGQESDCGNCSPFFSCEGCATATINIEFAQVEVSIVKALPIYQHFIPSPLPVVQYDVWQPPKLDA